ncbi:hypothetical protein BDZ97DRAFT_656824 [Flammula alnicola]|nr:hypothetical protein BDZ97DRAFT_656824 [Flammula alnicola]
MRNEIIALQSSTPQFYPSCSQVEVTGSGINVPSDNELVSMQTLYQGVTFPNIYGDSVSFTIPGPTPVTFGGIGGNTAPSSTISTSPSTVAPASTKQPSDQCRLTSRRLQRQKTV